MTMSRGKRNPKNNDTMRKTEENVNNSLRGLREQREIRSSIQSSLSSNINYILK